MKLIYIVLLNLLVFYISCLGTGTSTTVTTTATTNLGSKTVSGSTTLTKTHTLSKEEIEELERLEKLKLAELEKAKAKLMSKKQDFPVSPNNLDGEIQEDGMPTGEQIRSMSKEEQEAYLKKAQDEEASKEAIKNVPIYNLSGDIYWNGWVKYFHYDADTKLDRPDRFYENPHYYKEIVEYDKKEEKSSDGNYKYIQDKFHFWAKLLANGNLNILGSRHNEDNTLADSVDNLNTDLIGYVHPTNNAMGAIRDLGSFNEGFCISIETVVPDPKKDYNFNPRTQEGANQTWIICTDHEKEKNALMSYLVSIKLKRQKAIDDVGLEEEKSTLSVAQIMKAQSFKPKIEKYNGRGATKDDGYWILLQDWSECSLKCGGGKQIQQWMCVPPKDKGKPCIGDAIRSKPCNINPCPNVSSNGLDIGNKNKNSVTLKPIYKAMPYSKRPQQYVKCVIKEGDVLYKTKEYDPEKKKEVKVPGRIVMNAQTISVYKDDGYENNLFSFNLEDTVLKKADEDYCCFYLISANRQFEVCGFNNNCGTLENPVWVAKWGFDFELFQRKCYRQLKEPDLKNRKRGKNKQGVPAAGGSSVPLDSQQKEIVEGRRNIISKKVEANVQKKLDDKVGETQKVALTALRREINLEDLIKNEEIQKGREETQELYAEMNQEKKKKELLEQAIQTREANFGKARIAKETEKKIDGIKKDTKMDINFKRGVLKKKIEEIRGKFRRKHRQIKQQIQMIRAEIAKDIVGANKKGNAEICRAARNDVVKIKEYCDNSYSADYSKNQDCKDPQNFCYSCCDGEFGNLFISERDDCQSMCDDLEKADLNKGDWVWMDGGSQSGAEATGSKASPETPPQPLPLN